MKFMFSDSTSLAQCLQEFVENREYLKVPLRQNVQWLADLLRYNLKWVAVSPEELILRRHYDFNSGRFDQPDGRRPVDTFQHVNLFLQLGVCSGREAAENVVNSAIDNLVKVGMLKKGNASDGQAGYPTTRLAEPVRLINEAVLELRRRLNERRT